MSKLVSALHREPAVIYGLVLGLVSAVLTSITEARVGGTVDWLAAFAFMAPAVTGVLIRGAVFSPATVDQIRAAAEGVSQVSHTINVNLDNASGKRATTVASAVADAVAQATNTEPPPS